MYNSINNGMSESEMFALCKEYPLKNVVYWAGEIYGRSKETKLYGFYPTFLPLMIWSDHSGPYQSDEIFKVDLENDAPFVLYQSPRVVENFKKHSKKPCYVMSSPFVCYRRRKKIHQLPDACGTLAFPAHTTIDEDSDMDVDAYIEELMLLPKEFHPISACIYWHDVQNGLHRHFMKRGIPVYTAGHYTNPMFMENFYKIIRKFKYTTSNCLGSYIYFSVEMGIPFSLYGKKVGFINKKNINRPLGKYNDDKNGGIVERLENLFKGIYKEINEEQRKITEYELGLLHGISRFEMAKILYSALFNFYLKKFYLKKNN